MNTRVENMIVDDTKGQPANSGKIRVAIICGTQETSLHPVPPVADSAPEWNVFRLAEAVTTSDGLLDIHVISPCDAGQLQAFRDFTACGQYHHVVFHSFELWLYRRLLRHILPVRMAVRNLAKLPDLLSWRYLRRVTVLLQNLSPDLVFINARPQYIRYLRPLVSPGKLCLFMRGPLGESRCFLSLLDGIVINSDGMRNYAEQFVDSNSLRIWKMPNTLGDEFDVPSRNLCQEKNIIFAGRIIPEKGVLELLEAFRLALKYEPGIRMVICGASENFKLGGAPTAYEQEVYRVAGQFPPGIVEFRGYIPNGQMGRHYSEAYMAVFPSRSDIYVESFGMVALEAMRCGLPVIASRQPGFEELIVHGETGLIVDNPQNIRSLAEAMLTVLKDPQLARSMGGKGYQRSFNYTPAAAAQRFSEIVLEFA
jgi:glycosyltransferase involved in cell wall biosynthesis